MTSLKRSETQLQEDLINELRKVFSEHKRETLAPAAEACIRKHVKNWYPDNILKQADSINKELLSLVSSFIDDDIRKFFVRGHAWGNSTAKMVDELRGADPAIYHISKIEELDSNRFRSLLIQRCAYLKPSCSRFPKKFIPVWEAARAEYKESVKDLPLSSPQEQHASLLKEIDRIELNLDRGDLTVEQSMKLVNIKSQIIQKMNKLSPAVEKQTMNQLDQLDQALGIIFKLLEVIERLPDTRDIDINTLMVQIGLIKPTDTEDTKVIPQTISESEEG